MSIPPAMSTTSNPTAKMMLTELWLSRSNRLGSVRNVVVETLRPLTITAMRRISRASIEPIRHLRRSGMDVSFDLVHGCGARDILRHDAAIAHVQDTVRIEVDFRDLVGDQQDGHA